MYKQRRPGEIQTPTHWNLVACRMIASPPLIAQQYSSAMFLSVRCRSGMEKFGSRFNFFFLFLILKNCLV
jgi:hypothetical protein